MTHAPTQRARPDARHVDQWRTLRGEAGRALLETAEQTLSSIEGPVRRRPDQRERRRQLVEALLANLAEAALAPTPRPVIVPERLRKQVPARYRHPAFGKAVGPTTELLASAGLATMDKGTRKGRKATTLQPGPELLRLIADLGPSSANLGRAARRGDPIVLSVTTRGPKGRSCTWVDYQDTPETRAMRADMDRINGHLEAAPIALSEGASPVDLGDRWLSRRFKLLLEQPQRFDQSGRLFGGFWQPMAKVERGGLLIDGEPCVTLDYSTAFTRPDLPATIYSDSAHVVDGVNKWLDGWVAAGWMKRDGKPLQNVELWKHLWGLLEARAGAAPLSFVHVKAHAGEPRNEAVDRLANGAARVAAKDFYPECPMPTQFDPERGLVVPVWGPKDFEE